MHQAQITEWGQAPKYTEVSDPASPGPDEVRVKMIAAGLHRVVRSRAAGKHYTSGTLPHVPGMDGVGMTEGGKTIYFSSFSVGSMTEYVNVPKRSTMALPQGIDPVQAAGIINPAMSSWMAIKSRTADLPKDFCVLILGATSASGRVAIPLLRALGAQRIGGAARNQATLETLGLDSTIKIEDDVEKTDLSSLGDVDVILDYIYGTITVHVFNSLTTTKPVQYVHIGGLSALEISLPGTVLRSKNLTLRGSGPGAWSMRETGEYLPEMLEALRDVPEQPVKAVKLVNVESAWANEGSERIVFVP